MPIVVTETDSFPQVVRKPANGENADSASFDSFMDEFASRTRFLYNKSRARLFDVTRAPYNADPSLGADATAAIQAAINDANSAIGGGDVFLPGQFVYTGLTARPGVSLIGVPGITELRIDHASNNSLDWASGLSYTAYPYTRVSGIRFSAVVGNIGTVWNHQNPCSVIYENCFVNDPYCFSPQLNANIFYSNSTRSNIVIRDCYLRAIGSSGAWIINSGGTGRIVLRDSELVIPATYGVSPIVTDSEAFSMSGCLFDFTAHTSGSLNAIDITGTAVKRFVGNEFRGNAGTGVSIFKTHGFATSYLIERGNAFNGVTPYSLTGQLAAGSELSLIPGVAIDVGGAPSVTLPNGYRSLICKGTSASVALTMPQGYFPGQEFELTYYNAGVSAVAPTFAGIPVTATSVPTIGAGNTLTGVFVWEDRDVSGSGQRWIQKGTWGVGLTLV